MIQNASCTWSRLRSSWQILFNCGISLYQAFRSWRVNEKDFPFARHYLNAWNRLGDEESIMQIARWESFCVRSRQMETVDVFICNIRLYLVQRTFFMVLSLRTISKTEAIYNFQTLLILMLHVLAKLICSTQCFSGAFWSNSNSLSLSY